ncbi:MAG: ATP-binding protein [Pyrinomonadaceae bacterium]
MATTKYPRALEITLNRDLDIYPVVAVMGVRQVGKSTLCEKIAERRDFSTCTLDDSDYLRKASETPEILLDDLGPNAFIDEAQRAPGLFLAIKALVDREQRPGAYLLSGSNQPRMFGGIGDSLLGRAAYRTLRPLLLSELRFDESHAGWSFLFGKDEGEVLAELEARATSSGELDWREIVRAGGFPGTLAARNEDRTQILNNYIEVFTSRDIREVLGVESPERFGLFFRLICAWTGQELNASAISRDLGISVNTIRRWIDALKHSFMIEIIQPYSRNASQRVIKAPKVYVVDSALALVGAREIEQTGFHLETMICIDLLHWRDESPNRSVYHWRLAGGQEVDFILQENQELLPVEIKASTGISRQDARHVGTFRERHPNTPRGLLLSCDPEIKKLDKGIIAAPWWAVI